jgi:photosystem II stability/assembly factor-like uncharacterized protein
MPGSVALNRLALMIVVAPIAALPCPAATRAPTPTYLAPVINPDLNGGLLVAGSRVLLTWGSDSTILRSEDGVSWEHALTPGSADLTRVSANESGSVMIAVGASGTILRSIDTGRSWKAARNPVKGTDLSAVVHQGAGKTWIAAGTNGRILRSTDDGKHWSVVESQLKAAFQTLFVDPGTQSILIGGEDGLVGFSKDAGVTWQITALAMPDPVTPVTGFHRFGKLLIATSARGRFLTSEDDAASWDLMQASTQAFFTDCALDSRIGAIVMTAHNGDLLRSADGGRTWEGGEVALDGRKNYLTAIRFDERSGSLLVLDQASRVSRSTDGGITWIRISEDLHGEARGLISDPARGRLIAFGTGGMIASSTDSGAHWTHSRSAIGTQRRSRSGR